MASTSPIFVESVSSAPAHHGRVSEADGEVSDRLHRLEDEIAELRDTIARFADLMIGQVKDLKKAQQDWPLVPPSLAGELPSAGAPAETSTAGPRPPVEPNARRPWLLMELLRDFGSTLRMYLDPRYRVRRSTQLMVPLIVGLLALNCFVFNVVFTTKLISDIFEKLIDMVLAVILYQVIHREVARYRSVIAQLTAWQDYRARAVLVSGEPAMTTLETE